jgi:RNA polymerase sigma-70 factor, ECF subfamily
MSQSLEQALEELPEEYREVILLRDVESLTAPEAAESLGISVEALKSRSRPKSLRILRGVQVT